MKWPLWETLKNRRSVLLAGAGGGYDIFCGLPLYFALRDTGVEVHLANLSFSFLGGLTQPRIHPAVAQVNADADARSGYFPEKYLCEWFEEQGTPVVVHAFEKVGVRPLSDAYHALVDMLQVDAVVLVDGGTDSLMRGDEAGLGTPTEDIMSMAAVANLALEHRYLVCLGFGIDRFHGVCHAHFLEAVAALTKVNAFLGAYSLLGQSTEGLRYQQACEFVFERMSHHPSIVNASILSALDGDYGDVHRTHRTHGSTLWINPLMTLYWGFDLQAVVDRCLYLDWVRDTHSLWQVQAAIRAFRKETAPHKPWEDIPV